MAQRVVETVLRFKVDQAQVESAQRSLERLRADVLKSAGTSTISPVAGGAGGRVGQALGGGDAIGRAAVGAIQDATRNIPILGDAVQGLGSDAEQAIGKVAGVSPLLTAAVVAVGIGFVALEARLKDTKETLSAATTGLEAYYKLIADNATEEDVVARREELNRRLEAQQQELAVIENSFAGGFQSAVDQVGEIPGRVLFGLANAFSADDALTARADELRTSIQTTSAEVAALSRGLDEGAFAAAAAAEAEKKLAEARAQQLVQFNRDFLSAELEAANLAATGTEEAVQKRIEGLQREQAVLLEYAATIQRQIDNAAGDIAVQEALEKQLADVNTQIGTVTNTLTVFANEGLLETVRAADAAKSALEEETRIRESSIGVVKKYNEEVERIREQAAQQEIALADRLADQQVQIAERAAEDAQKALEDLQRTRAGLGTDLSRDLASASDDARREALDRQIEFQRDEVEATIRHQADLERIRRSAQEREFELGLSRDFAGLARSRRQTAGDLSETNQRFAEDRAQRARAFAAETEDNARQYAVEREQRIAKYQQDLIDAEQAYRLELAQSRQQTQRSLAEANTAYSRDLAQLRAKLTAELSARQQAAIGELRIIQQGQAVKLKLEEQYWIQAQKLVLAATANLGGSSTPSTNGGPSLPKSMSNIRAVGSSSAASAAGGSSGPQINLTLNVPITTGASADQVRGLPGAVQQIVRRELVAVFS
jgi:hypothetical protein